MKRCAILLALALAGCPKSQQRDAVDGGAGDRVDGAIPDSGETPSAAELLLVDQDGDEATIFASDLLGASRVLLRFDISDSARVFATGHLERRRLIVVAYEDFGERTQTLDEVFAFDIDTNERFEVLSRAEATAGFRCDGRFSEFEWSRSGEQVVVACLTPAEDGLFDVTSVLVGAERAVVLSDRSRVRETAAGLFSTTVRDLRRGLVDAEGNRVGPELDRLLALGAPQASDGSVPCGLTDFASVAGQRVLHAGRCSLEGRPLSSLVREVEAPAWIAGLPGNGDVWLARGDSTPMSSIATFEQIRSTGTNTVVRDCARPSFQITEAGSAFLFCMDGPIRHVRVSGAVQDFELPDTRITLDCTIAPLDATENLVVLFRDAGRAVFDLRSGTFPAREGSLAGRILGWLHPARSAVGWNNRDARMVAGSGC
ncbi:MAG: hypothetical protein AAGE52_00255 [Myxococcota bacterium]